MTVISSPCAISPSAYIDLCLGKETSAPEIKRFIKRITNNDFSLKSIFQKREGYSLKFQIATINSLRSKIKSGSVSVTGKNNGVDYSLRKAYYRIDNEMRKAEKSNNITKLNGGDDLQTQRMLSPKLFESWSINLSVSDKETRTNVALSQCRLGSIFESLYKHCCEKKLSTEETFSYMAAHGFLVDFNNSTVSRTIRCYKDNIKVLTNESGKIIDEVNRVISFSKECNLSISDTIEQIRQHAPDYDVMFIDNHHNGILGSSEPACFFDITKKTNVDFSDA
jgi:hypothetical protein